MNALTFPRVSRSLLDLEIEKEDCRRSLAYFVQQAWPHFDPAPYQHSWHIDAIAEHLEAVTSGEIKKLLINIPPRHMKTGLVTMWQVWTWTLLPEKGENAFNYLRGPGVQFLCGAYNATKAEADGVKARMLIRSDWFQKRWGDRVRISPYVDNASQFTTAAGGHRINVGIPESLGKGGIVRMLDDPHKSDDVESKTALETVIRNYNETWSTRSNDPVNGAEILIMQRQAAGDLSGHVLDLGGWTHLCIPLEYEPERHCVTSIGWQDPRGLDDETGQPLEGVGDPDEKNWCAELKARKGEPIWPLRFPSDWCREHEHKVGPYAFAGQYQQRPAPRGGGLIGSDQWRLWDKPAFPSFDIVVVSYDGAYTDKTYNDPSAATVWGRFYLPEVREPQFMLIWAWQRRLAFHEVIETLHRTCLSARGANVLDMDRELPDGGLKADHLLIEAKANGISAAQEIVRLYGRRKFRTWQITPKGDKTGRLLSVQHLFVGERLGAGFGPGQIWAPDTTVCQAVIDEVSMFPKASGDHYTDTVSMGLRWLRDMGAALTREEAEADWVEENSYRKPRKNLYPCA